MKLKRFSIDKMASFKAGNSQIRAIIINYTGLKVTAVKPFFGKKVLL